MAAATVSGSAVNSVIPYRGIIPKIDKSVFLAEGARVIGDVEIGADSSIWFNAVVRGDVHWIRIGARTNVQDNCVLHVTHQRYPLQVGSDVTVGHSAVLHGCTVEDCCLIGMGAIVLDNARIHSHSLVAAGSLVAGVPAKVKRPLTAEESAFLMRSAQNYVGYVKTYRE